MRERRLPVTDDGYNDDEWIDRHFQHPAEEDVFDHHQDSDEDDKKDGKNSTGQDNDAEGQPTSAPTLASNARGPLPPCQVNANGQFFVSAQAAQQFATGTNTQVTIVPFAYQIQGSIELNVDLLQSTVLPVLERELSARLVPELFAPQACQFTGTQKPPTSLTTFASNNDNPPSSTEGGIRRQLTNLSAGPAAFPVTGLQPAPQDFLLPNYEGVRCRTQLVGEADRCFVLTGAYSLSGPQRVDWALPIAQQATERVMNQQRALDDAHPLVEHVLYLGALDAEDMNSVRSLPPVLVDTHDSGTSPERIATGWAWVIAGAAVSLLVMAIVVLRRLRAQRGSYDDRKGCCSRGAGYLAYPSPDRSASPRQSAWEDADDPPQASQMSFHQEPMVSFQPALGTLILDSSDLENEDDEENHIMHDGSFPSSSHGSPRAAAPFPDDDESAALPFYDDDDESGNWRDNHIVAAPSSSWLRDLV